MVYTSVNEKHKHLQISYWKTKGAASRHYHICCCHGHSWYPILHHPYLNKVNCFRFIPCFYGYIFPELIQANKIEMLSGESISLTLSTNLVSTVKITKILCIRFDNLQLEKIR